jgi:acyl carrier protein
MLKTQEALGPILDVVKEVLTEVLGVEECEVTMGATLAADLGCDSCKYLDIIASLEKKYKIGDFAPDMHAVLTVTDLCRLIGGHLQK